MGTVGHCVGDVSVTRMTKNQKNARVEKRIQSYRDCDGHLSLERQRDLGTPDANIVVQIIYNIKKIDC